MNRKQRTARAIRWLLPVLLTALFAMPAKATHIVGGELNYTYLGGDSVYVKIKVYRDSINAEPYFDSPLRLYIFDSSRVWVNTYNIQLPNEALIVPQIDDSCFVEPPNVLVDYVIYEDTLYIPGLTPGYTFAYFRCCRNNNILNIESVDFISGDTLPGELTGAVYPAELPRTTKENSNPEFNTFPPVAICANKQLDYDHSAFDPDGDSLVYELCTPYTGGNRDFVFGNPAFQRPPFQEVLFIPPYSLDNVMGGYPLEIDPQTGLLTAIPNTLGRFVIAVCVNEYRDGELLARHRRDFQFNVVDCSRVFNGDFSVSPAPKIDTLTPFSYLFCDTTLTKNFTAILNEPTSVKWFFGDGQTSTEQNPTHAFPDTGTYEVTLITGPGEQCADTIMKRINIQRHIIGADFDFDQAPCDETNPSVQFTDASFADEPIVEWVWDFGDLSTSTESNPLHAFPDSGSYLVNLLIYASNGCCTGTTKLVQTTLLDPIAVPDTLASCDGDSVLITLEAPGVNSYGWTPATGLSDPTVQQPLAFPSVNTQYIVAVRTELPGGETCLRYDTCVVLVEEVLPDIAIDSAQSVCSPEISLFASTDFPQPVSWLWFLDETLADTLSTTALLETTMPDVVWTYYVEASTRYCSRIEPVQVEGSFLGLDVGPLVQCGSTPLLVEYEIFSPPGDVSLQWTYGDSSFSTTAPFTINALPGESPLVVEGVNAQGCTYADTLSIFSFTIPEVTATADPSEVLSGESVLLDATSGTGFSYNWSPPDLVDNPDAPSTSATVQTTTIFEVYVVDTNGCAALDTVLVIVTDVVCDEGVIFIPNAFSPNGDGLNDVFRPRGEAIEAMVLQIYDRWGNLVFEGTDMDAGWDGRRDGELLSGDSYGYQLEILCAGDAVFYKKGNVTLVR